MRVLIGCAYSDVECNEFRKRGHDAYSCDLLPSESGSEFHIQGDVRDVLDDGWDLGIFHPDCTFLTCSAAWAFGDGPYHQKVKPETLTGQARRDARDEALLFVGLLMACKIKRKAIENPAINFICTFIRRPDQVIQPHEFGHDASKATGLWLDGLPKLIPTKHVVPRMVAGLPRWGNQTDSGQNKLTPGPDRWKERARTYDGWAVAMAEQWGCL